MQDTDRIILLDLDRTLFDTNRFVERVWQVLHAVYPKVDPDASRHLAKYRSRKGDLYDYDFFAHVSAEAHTSDSVDLITSKLVKELAGERFLYDDVSKELLSNIDAIVTYGNVPFQSLKLSLCPELATIPTHIIQENKYEFIVRHFNDRPTLLIDDKDLFDETRPPHRFIRIVRDDIDTLAASKKRGSVISSLSQLADV